MVSKITWVSKFPRKAPRAPAGAKDSTVVMACLEVESSLAAVTPTIHSSGFPSQHRIKRPKE